MFIPPHPGSSLSAPAAESGPARASILDPASAADRASSARRRRRAAPVVALAAVVALVAGCTSAGSAGSSAGTSLDGSEAEAASGTEHTVARELPADLGSDQPDGEFPREVAHYEGSTTIPAAPERIAVVSTGQLDALLSLDVVPIAATRAENSGLVPDYLADARPDLSDELASMADIGGRTEPDVEAIAQADPDLILINSVRGADLYEALSAIAPTVITLGNGVNWKTDYLLLADALGREGDAQAQLDSLHDDADAFAATLPDPAPTVSFLQSTGDRTRIMGVPSFTGGLAEDLGLGRPESQRFDETSNEISAEQLELADADVVFYAGQGSGLSLIEDAALWPTLTAVADDHAVEVDLDPFFLNAGPIAAGIVVDTIETAVGS